MQNVEKVRAANSVREAAVDAHALSRLAEIAAALGERSTTDNICRLVSRIDEGRFFVACVGQFKRGKSTLLDALVGEEILPTGVVPVTTVPTVLRHGMQRTARVLIDGQWRTIRPEDLAQYVSEELNPENEKRVEGVEAFLPSPLLASGMCLVDTPGIGSVFSANTDATKDFIPQIDAAILVVGADPPISGEEAALVEAVAANVDHILIVLNKIDRVSPGERQQAAAFASKVLEARLKKPVGRIYEVSALSNLQRAPNGDDWNTLIEDLSRLAKSSGQDMTRAAAERGVRRFSASLRRSVEERIRALQEPIENSEQRIANLHQTVSQAEQSLRDLGALFSAEQMRLSNTLLARRKQFLREVSPTAFQELQQETDPVKTAFGPALRRELMSIAQTVARRHVMPWLDSEETHAEELYAAVTQRFVGLVNGLLQRISEEQSADFAHLPKALDAEQGFRTRSRFYFHDMITIAQPASPLLYCMDLVMGALHLRHWFRHDAEKFLEQLLDTNASRVQGDAEQRVVESRLRLESDVRKLLREVSATAEQALTKAREVMAAGTTAVQDELEWLRRLLKELDAFSGAS
ncbi:MAG TPA: dynamin family protein [Terriglobales bacterium]|nr:dynamin family protein [Terriglobales bacterium]